MKLSGVLILIAMGLFFNSCVRSEDPETKSTSIIRNKSNHYIQVKFYRKNVMTNDLALATDEYEEFTFQETYGNLFMFEFSDRDSAQVIFDQKDSIMHYPGGNKGAARSILKLDSWKAITVRDYFYEYEYVFTDDDYLEASQ